MSALRIERVSTAAGRGNAAIPPLEFQWVVYSGAVAVLRCEAEDDARALLQVLSAKQARTAVAAGRA